MEYRSLLALLALCALPCALNATDKEEVKKDPAAEGFTATCERKACDSTACKRNEVAATVEDADAAETKEVKRGCPLCKPKPKPKKDGSAADTEKDAEKACDCNNDDEDDDE